MKSQGELEWWRKAVDRTSNPGFVSITFITQEKLEMKSKQDFVKMSRVETGYCQVERSRTESETEVNNILCPDRPRSVPRTWRFLQQQTNTPLRAALRAYLVYVRFAERNARRGIDRDDVSVWDGDERQTHASIRRVGPKRNERRWRHKLKWSERGWNRERFSSNILRRFSENRSQQNNKGTNGRLIYKKLLRGFFTLSLTLTTYNHNNPT